MNEDGEIVLGNISAVFDRICASVYERCKPVIIELCKTTSDHLDESNISEAEHKIDNYRYNNIMMFHTVKYKSKMLKEIMPMIK
jgi:hypothetical protein